MCNTSRDTWREGTLNVPHLSRHSDGRKFENIHTSTVTTFGGILFIRSTTSSSSGSFAVTIVVTPATFCHSRSPSSYAASSDRGGPGTSRFEEEGDCIGRILALSLFCKEEGRVEALSLEVIQWSTRTLKKTGGIDISWRSRM